MGGNFIDINSQPPVRNVRKYHQYTPVLGVPDTPVPTVEPPKLSFGAAEVPTTEAVGVCWEEIAPCAKPGVAATATLPVPKPKFVVPV